MISKYDNDEFNQRDERIPHLRMSSLRQKFFHENKVLVILSAIIIILSTIWIGFYTYHWGKLYYLSISQAGAIDKAVSKAVQEGQEFGIYLYGKEEEFSSKPKLELIIKEELEYQAQSEVKTKDARVLIFIATSYKDAQRRELIRSMQINIFKDLPIDWRFFLTNASEYYRKEIEYENLMYNDTVVLSNVEDDIHTLNKTMYFEILKYIQENMPDYNLVCKLDSEAFLNLKTLWPEYLEPNLYKKEPTFIGRILDSLEANLTLQLVQPRVHSAFVAINWNLMRLVNKLYYIHWKVGDYAFAEIQLSHYLKDDIINYNNLTLSHKSSPHFDPKETNFTKPNHIITPDAVYVDELKTENDYLKVASCFDSNGLDYDRANEILGQAIP